MKILLFNDNPVVRKLVALSAQKTKDDLSVISSVDEIAEGGYDLLIIDDALYSDEVFASLKELVLFKGTLLMATRGKAVPAGFENVINKPFLPTDLVDMFVQIERKLSSHPDVSQTMKSQEAPIKEESLHAANLEDTLPGMEDDDGMDSFDLSGDLDMDDDIGGFEDFEETDLPTAILDREEVQEVQNLLDDTESDGENPEDEIIIKGFDDNELEELSGLEELGEFEEHDLPNEENSVESLLTDNLVLDENEFDFGDDDLNLLADDTADETKEDFSDELLLDEGSFGEIETLPESKIEEDFGLMNEDLASLAEEAELGEETFSPGIEEDLLLEDGELDDLESQIQNAVSTLESETLDEELEFDSLGIDFDDALMEELNMDESSEADDLEGFDELDMLDERELKLAIGEEVEDEEVDLHVSEGDTSLSAEALDEVMGKSDSYETLGEELGDLAEIEATTHAEGVEALQALLKALSNEDVVKSLKGLNISININFGEGV